MNKIEEKLKNKINDLFASQKIDLVIGHVDKNIPGRTGVKFIEDKIETDKLIWNSFCTNNIAVYLPQLFVKDPHLKKEIVFPKIGMIAKGCDTRSITGLIIENQIPRENIVVIGMPCLGMIDRKKLEAQFPQEEILSIDDGENDLEVMTSAGKKVKIKKEDVIADACKECVHPAPDCVDIKIEGPSRTPSNIRFKNLNQFEKKTIEERWKYFADEFSKCIRCNACRQACPNCYCRECFIDQTKPVWAGKSDELSETMLYHIGRIFHQAGRCVECDACVKACPMGIDLRPFTQKIVKDSEELFQYTAGLSRDAQLPLTTFKEDDSQDFITEP